MKTTFLHSKECQTIGSISVHFGRSETTLSSIKIATQSRRTILLSFFGSGWCLNHLIFLSHYCCTQVTRILGAFGYCTPLPILKLPPHFHQPLPQGIYVLKITFQGIISSTIHSVNSWVCFLYDFWFWEFFFACNCLLFLWSFMTAAKLYCWWMRKNITKKGLVCEPLLTHMEGFHHGHHQPCSSDLLVKHTEKWWAVKTMIWAQNN